MSVLEFIKKQLRRYRDLLANLSRKNRELYFREVRGSTLNLSKRPIVEDHFKELFAEKFRPLKFTSSSFSEILEKGSFDLTDHFLLQETNSTELHKRLDKIRLADDKYQREFGISGAWFLGPFILWRDRHDFKPEELLISPVFKLPIDLVKDKKKHWQLRLEDAQLTVNPSLKLALKTRWGIELPEILNADNSQSAILQLQQIFEKTGKSLNILDSHYDAVPKVLPRYKIIKDENGDIIEKQPIKIHEALSEEEMKIYNDVTHQSFSLIDAIYIDQLNASRTVLISDYDSILESSEMHPILSELFLGKPIAGERSVGREKIRELDSYKERENFFVVNIDSTQHRAIDKVSSERAVVIQGPPGTGKSQTITNLIANNLAKGKKVLFVSEKRPALDVVYSRLQQANLASQSVLIHSSDLNKQDLYQSFLELAHAVPDRETDRHWEKTTSDLDDTKNEVNQYYDFLAQRHSPSELSVSDLLTISAEYSDAGANAFIFNSLKHLTYSELSSLEEHLIELERLVKLVPHFSKHPWLKRKPGVIYSETFVHSFKALIEQLLKCEKVSCDLRNELNRLTGSQSFSDLPAVDLTEQLSNVSIPEAVDFPAAKFFSDSNEIRRFELAVSDPLKIIEENKSYYALIRADADPELVRQLELYYTVGRNWIDWFTPSFWKMRRQRQTICPSWEGTVKPFKSHRLIRESIAMIKSTCKTFDINLSIPSDGLELLHKPMQSLRSSIRTISDLGSIAKKIGPIFFQKFSNFTFDTFPEIKSSFKTLSQLQHRWTQNIATLDQLYANLDGHFLVPVELDRYSQNRPAYELLIQTVKDLDGLDRVSLQLEKLKKYLRGSETDVFLSHLITLSNPWAITSKSVVLRGWVDDLRAHSPALRTFESEGFTKKISKFQTLEQIHRESARDTVNNTLFQRWNGGQGEQEGIGLLTKEANKQRKVLSPREIMERGALSAMMKLKPCWLMSPLSISQMLPLQSGLFDVIIFDEASQVRVEDAVPSIFRCNSMVVVGDPKQMPPTNFFSGAEQTDDDDENENEIAPSILDMASQVYPSEMLEWHYRSRSEALIAYSNRAFYGGRLIAVPNPFFITEGDSLHYHQISNGYFNQKDGNQAEATAIVEAAYKLLKQHPDKSVGVIAMGQSQMLTIETIIEQRSSSDSAFREIVERARNFKDGDADAGFFVKNLENVQGDERDIILMSVGYASAGLGRKLRLGFGPISIPGGGRRLNVAITRAKQQMHVFCSFDPNEIPTDEAAFSKNPDTVFFGRYLKYVKAVSEKRTADALSILDSFGVGGAITTRKNSRFSKDVQRRLCELGYQVSAEIGSSGFYIDLAVHHPIIPSNFVLGIECDGALFHSTPYARDRDKIRKELLESRGWKIERIWSQDWSNDWKTEVARLDKLLKAILEDASKVNTKLKIVSF